MTKQIKKTWPEVTVLGPTPAFYERLGGNYRWQLIVKNTKRQTLTTIAAHMPAHWQYDLDPVNLL
jgi:primosomal protein N'